MSVTLTSFFRYKLYPFKGSSPFRVILIVGVALLVNHFLRIPFYHHNDVPSLINSPPLVIASADANHLQPKHKNLPAAHFASQALQIPTKTSAPISPLLRVIQTLSTHQSIVYLSNFYSERNLSYAVSSENGIIKSLSLNAVGGDLLSSRLESDLHHDVQNAMWYRSRKEDMVLLKKKKYMSTFPQLVEFLQRVVNLNESYHDDRRGAVRFHSYLKHCYFLNKAGVTAVDLPVPLLLTTRLDENVGYFSSDVPGRTCSRTDTFDHKGNKCRDIFDMSDMLRQCNGKTYSDYRALLNHKNILLVLTSQHHAFAHDKLWSLPLGVRPLMAQSIARVHQQLLTSSSYYGNYSDAVMSSSSIGTNKTRLVMINNSGWWYRDTVNRYYQENFGEENSYFANRRISSSLKAQGPGAVREKYLRDIAASKFVVCPPGIGYDCYRVWEVLAMGSFPIVEHSLGLDKLYSYLPVLVVRDLTNVSATLLHAAYTCFMENLGMWKYDWLTQRYWDGAIAKALAEGSIAHLVDNHPVRNPHCSFLDSN